MSALRFLGFFKESLVSERVNEYEDGDELKPSRDHVKDKHPFAQR